MAYIQGCEPVDLVIPAIHREDFVSECTTQVYIRVLEEHRPISLITEEMAIEHRVRCVMECIDEIVCVTMTGMSEGVAAVLAEWRERKVNILLVKEI